jgi:aminoglycoside phosphotransferase (APT) family kinase protein
MKICYSLDSRLRGNDKGRCGNDKKRSGNDKKRSGNDKNAQACATRWNNHPIWIHGDFAIGNILVSNRHCEEHSDAAIQKKNDDWIASPSARNDGSAYKLSAIIDFGGVAVGDPACDLVIAWTYLSGKAREIFISKMDMDADTWLRTRAWALWKATFELCQIADKNSHEAEVQKRIIDEVMI